MNMCRHHSIDLWQVEREESYLFSIKASDYKKIKSMAKKTGVHPHILHKSGFPFLVHWLIKNWTFSTGFLFFLFLLLVMSSYVWQISFQGQRTYTKETLLKTVNEMGVHRGMKRSRLVCDEIEKNLRQRYSDISWVSAEEQGSRLVISIREAEKVVSRQSDEKPCHLVAAESGVVRSISVNRGIAAVKKGQKVKKGQILIRGIVPITNDDNEVVEKVPVAARGAVSLYGEEVISETVNVKKREKQYTGRRITRYDWEIGEIAFSLKNPFKWFNNSHNYDIIGTKKMDYTIQPFSFSVAMDEYEYREYEWKTVLLNKRQIGQEGKKRYERWKRSLAAKGYRILSHSAHVGKRDAMTWELSGKIGFLCKNTKKKYIEKNAEELRVVQKEKGREG